MTGFTGQELIMALSSLGAGIAMVAMIGVGIGIGIFLSFGPRCRIRIYGGRVIVRFIDSTGCYRHDCKN